ncbi:2-hydroxychromene-2-carboxylate isomerase [Nioella sp.]|uniref:2-hydroxychromene-2-carboxylate isomerase n=1 Tax=Nioella sp. TaxID=1912091 RepID=UPI003B52477F
MANIDYYFSTLSPFTYLAGTRLEEIATRHGATITYKPMDIATLFTRTGGVALPDRHAARKAYRLQELRRGAKKAGLPINEQPFFFPTNPAPSSYAIISAQKAGGGDLGGLVHGMLAAIWAGNRDIADNEVIRAVLSENGFDPDLADKGMLTAAEEYARNLEDAVSANVFGSPFYIVDGSECFWGHDRLDDLDAYLAGDL